MWHWLRQLDSVRSRLGQSLARAPRRAIPERMWRELLARYPFLDGRGKEQEGMLRQLCLRFLDQKEFHGAKGLLVTDEMALAIAAQACLPVLHLGLHWYDDFVGIVVQPGEVVARREVTDEFGVVHRFTEVLVGEAMEQGPVMLSWPDVEMAGQAGRDGYNLVIHEFAHKLDMRDGRADGCPPLPMGFAGTQSGQQARTLWLAALQEEFDRFRERVVIAERFSGTPTWLDSYGASALDEFFAVACEGYFVNRNRFTEEHPRLRPLFDGFFNPVRSA